MIESSIDLLKQLSLNWSQASVSGVSYVYFYVSVVHLAEARWWSAVPSTRQNSSHLFVKRVLIEHSLKLVWEQISLSLGEGWLLVFLLPVVIVVGVLGRCLLGSRALDHELVVVKLVDRGNSCSWWEEILFMLLEYVLYLRDRNMCCSHRLITHR